MNLGHLVVTPALVLDVQRLDTNLARMAERAAVLGVRLRPHLKTAKSFCKWMVTASMIQKI